MLWRTPALGIRLPALVVYTRRRHSLTPARRRVAMARERHPMSANIAILDDDQVFRTFLCAVLADAGYEPVALVAGIGVHEALRDFAPAAIILDVPHDPSASALHWPALAVLAQEATLRHVPVLAYVPDGDDDATRQVAALGLPFSTLLCKPVALIGEMPRAA